MTSVIVLTPEELSALVESAVRKVVSATPSAEANVLTREQVAKILQVHPNVVSRYVRRDGLPALKMGGEWRFMRDEVKAWLAARDRVDAKQKGAA